MTWFYHLCAESDASGLLIITLLLADAAERIEGDGLAVEDVLDALATHDVLNLAAAEVILRCKSLCRLLVNLGHHGTPNLRLDLLLWLVELDAEEEAALECLVERTWKNGKTIESELKKIKCRKLSPA